MKVLFLDIDGVLNGDRFVPEDDNSGVLIDKSRLDIIKHIVDNTGAKIVLSSSWKNHWEKNDEACDENGKQINQLLATKGLTIYDKTPHRNNDKKTEIITWLGEHEDVSNFVVLDDDPFAEGILKNHFVLTSHLRYGIDEYDAEKAIEILKN